MNRTVVGIVALIAATLTGFAAESAPLAVDSETTVPRWNRVSTPSVPLRWDWDESWLTDEATQVTLRIAGVNNATIEETFSKPVAEYSWNAYTQSADFREDVYEVTLIFKDAQGTPLTTKTARLDLLAGPFTGTSVMTADTNSASWRRVRNGSLIPYDRTWRLDSYSANTATLTWLHQEEQVQTVDLDTAVTGYYPWQTVGWEKGDYELQLMFGETPAWTALVSLFPDSTLLLMR